MHHFQLNAIDAFSRRGAIQLDIFNGLMNLVGFQRCLEFFLIPFINSNFPDGHSVQMDNAPSHKSISTNKLFRQNEINHFKTPAHITYHVNSNKTEELRLGILEFWKKLVTVSYCFSKINQYLKRVFFFEETQPDFNFKLI